MCRKYLWQIIINQHKHIHNNQNSIVHSFLNLGFCCLVTFNLTNRHVRFTLYLPAKQSKGKDCRQKTSFEMFGLYLYWACMQKSLLQYHKFVLILIYGIQFIHRTLEEGLKRRRGYCKGGGFHSRSRFSTLCRNERERKILPHLIGRPLIFCVNWHHIIFNCFCLCVLWFESVSLTNANDFDWSLVTNNIILALWKTCLCVLS